MNRRTVARRQWFKAKRSPPSINAIGGLVRQLCEEKRSNYGYFEGGDIVRHGFGRWMVGPLMVGWWFLVWERQL